LLAHQFTLGANDFNKLVELNEPIAIVPFHVQLANALSRIGIAGSTGFGTGVEAATQPEIHSSSSAMTTRELARSFSQLRHKSQTYVHPASVRP